MVNQILRGKRGEKLGEIKEQNGKLVLYDVRNSKKGEYDPKTNITRDTRNSIVGKGNLLTTLL